MKIAVYSNNDYEFFNINISNVRNIHNGDILFLKSCSERDKIPEKYNNKFFKVKFHVFKMCGETSLYTDCLILELYDLFKF